MSDEEKKFKISELPDEGSSSSPKNPKKTFVKKEAEPRLEKLQLLSEREKVAVMTQTWHFDRPEWKFTWVIYVLILVAAQVSTPYQAYLNEIELLNKLTMDLGGDVVRAFTTYLEFLVRNPLILALLTPLFFKFTSVSDYHFEITFDGIKTVKRIVPTGSKELVSRTFIKWSEISGVEKGMSGNREVLRLHSLDGKAAEIIWDIGLDKQKAIKLLLNGLINNKHPLRVFLDNEKDLK